MKKTLFILFITGALAINSQNESISGGAGHFRFGYANYNMSSLNAWLPNVYPTIKNNFITSGGTGYAIRNNVIVGGEGFASIGSTVSRDTLSISPRIGRGMLNVGYVMYDYHNFIVYPLVGFGGGGTTIRFRENPGFGNVVNQVKEKDYALTNSNLMLSFSLGADSYFITEGHKHGFSIGIRLGYIYSLQNSTWRKDDAEIAGPNVNSSGFYFTIGIGGGHLHRK